MNPLASLITLGGISAIGITLLIVDKIEKKPKKFGAVETSRSPEDLEKCEQMIADLVSSARFAESLQHSRQRTSIALRDEAEASLDDTMIRASKLFCR